MAGICDVLDYTTFTTAREYVCVANCLMGAVCEREPLEARISQWCKLEDALERLTYEESRKTLQQAKEKVLRLM